MDVVFGSKNKVKIKEIERNKFPAKHSKEREMLVQLLKDREKWDDVVQLDATALNKIIQEKQWDNELLDILDEYVKLEKSKRLYLSKIKNFYNTFILKIRGKSINFEFHFIFFENCRLKFYE